MTLPNLLGIGAMRAATTWLDAVLRTHPEVFLPPGRKEIGFFDRFYDRGIDWYADLFPTGEEAERYRWIGEVTPAYLAHPDAAGRIARALPDCRFLLVLRDPAERAYSQWKHSVLYFGERRGFDEALEADPRIIERGLYCQHLRRFLEHYPIERFLVLLFDEVKEAPEAVVRRLADFLGIPEEGFSLEAAKERRNEAVIPRYRRAFGLLRRINSFLTRRNMDRVRTALGARRIARLLKGRGRPFAPLAPATRRRLVDEYGDELAALEKLLGLDLSRWRRTT